ncbi:MAG TPA: DNA recombination protein RmuC [Candidatus Tumulicola sp.]|nr:DNA recombination protein RmuC [Candidatus Tumulicola sp.]
MTIAPMLWVLGALLLGALAAWLFREREIGLLRTAAVEQKARAGELVVQLSRSEANLSESRAALAAANERAAALGDRLGAERDAFERQRVGLDEKMAGQFAGLAQRTLDGVTRTFLDLAAARLGEERQALTGSLGAKVEEIKGVMTPVRDEFTKFSAAVAALEKNSADNLGALRGSIEQVTRLQTTLQDAVRTTNDTTGQLRNALQNPRVAGNWGEISLDRIVELGGMTEHCDFDRQSGVRSTDGTSERPDLIVRLTDGLRIPVDAKASSANYVRAAGESDEAERQRLLKQSALDIKSRITELRGRSYDRIEGYAGMTILFVPNESMLSSAMALEPNLIEDALRDKIVICSPLLLLCYLRAFANGWRIAQQQDNAEEVARRGRMLHDRLLTFFGAVGKVGWYLNHTVEKFNIAVGKMDNLLVPGRELGKLLAKNDELMPVNTVDTAIRPVRFGDAENGDGEPALARGRG